MGACSRADIDMLVLGYTEIESCGKQCLSVKVVWELEICILSSDILCLSANTLASKGFSVPICKIEIQISTFCFVGRIKSITWHLAYSKCLASRPLSLTFRLYI